MHRPRPSARGRRSRDVRRLDLQDEHRLRHEGAGIAGGNGRVGTAFAHRLEAQPHAGMPAALAQRLARLRIHGDGNIGVEDLGLGGERRLAL